MTIAVKKMWEKTSIGAIAPQKFDYRKPSFFNHSFSATLSGVIDFRRFVFNTAIDNNLTRFLFFKNQWVQIEIRFIQPINFSQKNDLFTHADFFLCNKYQLNGNEIIQTREYFTEANNINFDTLLKEQERNPLFFHSRKDNLTQNDILSFWNYLHESEFIVIKAISFKNANEFQISAPSGEQLLAEIEDFMRFRLEPSKKETWIHMQSGVKSYSTNAIVQRDVKKEILPEEKKRAYITVFWERITTSNFVLLENYAKKNNFRLRRVLNPWKTQLQNAGIDVKNANYVFQSLSKDVTWAEISNLLSHIRPLMHVNAVHYKNIVLNADRISSAKDTNFDEKLEQFWTQIQTVSTNFS